MATTDGEPRGRGGDNLEGDLDLLCDDNDSNRINRIGRLKRGVATNGDRPLSRGGGQCESSDG